MKHTILSPSLISQIYIFAKLHNQMYIYIDICVCVCEKSIQVYVKIAIEFIQRHLMIEKKICNDWIPIICIENKLLFNVWGHLRFIKWKDFFQGFIDLSSRELPFSLPAPT